MSQWYCLVNKEKYGPVGEEELKQWIADGRLGGDDLVVQPGMAEWVKVSTVPEFAGLASDSTAGHVPSQPRPSYEPHRGGAILTLGIIGLPLSCCCLGLVFGIIAWVMGSGDMKKIDAALMDPTGRGMTQAGMILGIIATILSGILIVLNVIGAAVGEHPYSGY